MESTAEFTSMSNEIIKLGVRAVAIGLIMVVTTAIILMACLIMYPEMHKMAEEYAIYTYIFSVVLMTTGWVATIFERDNDD